MVLVISKKTFIYSLIAVTLLGFFSCSNPQPKNTKKIIKVKLRQGWFPWAGYAGEVVAMHETDSLNGIDLQVDPGADDIDPMKMVISGQDDFGITSAESIILANQKGSDLVAIATINYKSPTCFITLKKSNITTPKSFEGKKVGILTGSETETVYRTLINKLNLDKKKITEVEAPYDLKTFIYGAYDVYPGFIYSEPIALEKQNVQYNIIKPEDYGVELMGAVYFTTKKFIDANPKIVQSFINALADGWKIALKDPGKAMQYLKQYDKTIDESREFESLKRGSPYFAGEKGLILYSSDSSWANLKSALVQLNMIPETIDIKKNYNYNFVAKHYNLLSQE